jgi:hypothetical protein
MKNQRQATQNQGQGKRRQHGNEDGGSNTATDTPGRQ